MDKKRMINNFIEMVKIYSPSKKEGNYVEYLSKIFQNLGMEVYLDKSFTKYGGDGATLIAKLSGSIIGDGITLAAHTDVVGPCKNVNPIFENGIIKTDGTTTLGGDDKAGIASIIETINVIKENNLKHEDIYVILTPSEEIGMLGAKNIDWELIPENMVPSKNMIVIDNSGPAGFIAHTAPGRYDFKITFLGKKAHAGIEPEKGINAIQLAAKAIGKIKIGRIDETSTSNLGTIESNFPSNIVADLCIVTGEVRGHSEDKIFNILNEYELQCQNAVKEFGGNYSFEKTCAFPPLKPIDQLVFAKNFSKVYESLGIDSKLQVIGGGSDSNIFAEKDYNSIIIGVGMANVHTVEETLDTNELIKTTEALIKYISK
ncbi:MAG: M20/M25/M40 family metallo-hydrolase [Fusobacteriaceae bacterium]